MGIVEKILSKNKTDPESVISTDDISIELSENFHLHYRNSRLELDHEEWQKISKQIISSYLKWLMLFSPKSGDIDNSGKQIFFSKSKLSSIPGEKNDFVRSNEIRVELQKWADYIHIHYKSLRLEFSIDEFLEFAKTIEEGKKNLLKEYNIDEIPKREGKFHVPCPRGRVNFKNNEFWTEAGQDNFLNDKHKSIYLDKNDDMNMDSKLNLPKNNFFSNFMCKLLVKFPRIGKIFGVRLK
tara:strand:+ start:164 stop:880 length:717 start_codon:yes stop_codon:yes gene_type:complete